MNGSAGKTKFVYYKIKCQQATVLLLVLSYYLFIIFWWSACMKRIKAIYSIIPSAAQSACA